MPASVPLLECRKPSQHSSAAESSPVAHANASSPTQTDEHATRSKWCSSTGNVPTRPLWSPWNQQVLRLQRHPAPMFHWAHQLVPDAPETALHQDHVLLNCATTRETPSLLSKTTLQCARCANQVRVHEQVPAPWAIRFVFFILQRMHAQQLFAEDSEPSDDSTYAPSASSDCSTPATANSNAIKRNAMQKLQVD
jgi:hypothetical protein